MSPLVSLIVISAVWMEASSGSISLLVMSMNTAAKPTFLPLLFDLLVVVTASSLLYPSVLPYIFLSVLLGTLL